LGTFLALGASPEDLFGVDLLEERVREARRRYSESKFTCGSAEQLDFPNSHFDLASAFTVFSSILDDSMSRQVALEMRRVLKPGGAVVWYDMRYSNPWNPNVRGMTSRAIMELFPDFDHHLRSVTVVPQVARRLGATTSLLYPFLNSFPFLRTHYIGLLLFKPASTNF
jgi:ubiquinone/menaquinone biosynthesis C-methylase UbiE